MNSVWFQMIRSCVLQTIILQVKAEKKEIANVIGPEQTRKHNLVTVMFVIVGIFLICNLAEPTFYLYRVVFHEPKRADVCFFWITVNASVNAVVYGILNQTYRKTLFKLVCRTPKQTKSLENPRLKLETLQKTLKTQKSL